MSFVAIHAPVVIFREEQNFDWRVYALLGLVVLSGITVLGLIPISNTARTLLAIFVGMVPSCLIVYLLRMTTEITPTGILIWFGWIPSYRRVVSLGAITQVEVVAYRPIRDYGGWGIRHCRDGERLLSARGDRGVRVQLADGSRLLIGSQRPEELARVIEETLRPGV